MQTAVVQLIEVLAEDVIAGSKAKPQLAVNAEFELTLLALLLHYNTGETLRDLVESAK